MPRSQNPLTIVFANEFSNKKQIPSLNRRRSEELLREYLVFSNAFAELRRNALGKPLRLETSPAKYLCRGVEGVFIDL